MIKWIKKKLAERKQKKLDKERSARKRWESTAYPKTISGNTIYGDVAGRDLNKEVVVNNSTHNFVDGMFTGYILNDVVSKVTSSHKTAQAIYNDTEPYTDNITKTTSVSDSDSSYSSSSYDSGSSYSSSSYDSGSSYSSPSYDSGSSYDSGGSSNDW